jgi:catechol 2,3-dioxygenase-like lactoylglutathione lyase family enzyme
VTGIPARLTLVTLGVDDLERAIAFYEALGWTRSSASVEGEIAWFQTSGSVIGLWDRSKLAQDAGLEPQPPGAFDGVTMAINVETEEEVSAALDAAVAAGGRLLKPATRMDWGGLSGYFADPDGHPWEVTWNPTFKIGPDGRLRL